MARYSILDSWAVRLRELRAGRRPAPGDRLAAGQILVMFAFMLTVLLGAVGLSIDLGAAFMQRRTMQAAADAGALAGTRIVSKSTAASPLSAQGDVIAVVNANMSKLGTITALTCRYVTDAATEVGDCSGTVPASASGVKVTVTESHPTFFIRVVPGGPSAVSTGAVARGNVKKLGFPSDGPYLPCGVNTQLGAGGTMSLVLKTGGTWIINAAAVGQTFKIHGPQIEKCDAKASRYKGLADTDVNRNKTAPNWFTYKEGDSAGLISTDVDGIDGCKAGQEVVNCVVFLPIVVNDPAESGNDRQLWTVGFAPFYITAPKSNEHYGKLLADYIVFGKGQDGSYGWVQGYSGPITIRLTE
jgi:Flp pilus assembly protein TadG